MGFTVGEGWQLFKIAGIPLRIHPSWFFILALATVAFQERYKVSLTPAADLGAAASPSIVIGFWGLGFLTALLLFVSVLLHELGHSLVALAQGVKVKSITLFLLGGVASVERECSTAIGALSVAAAGPAVSLVLAACLLASSAWASNFAPWLGVMVGELGSLNLVLGLFNLLPGLPLDGGLIVKALVWQLSGSQRRGVEVANTCGRLLAYLAITLGVLILLRGGGMGGAWLMLLGWFGLGAVRNQQQLLKLQSALQSLRVRDAASRRFRVMEADATLRDLSRLRLDEGGSVGLPDWLLVCNRGRWRGIVDDDTLKALPVQRWDTDRLADHLRPLSSLASIDVNAPLWQAVQQLEESNVPRLLVLSPAGLPSGTLERPELGEAVLQRLGLKLPGQLLELARRHNAYPLGLDLRQVVRGMVASGEVMPEPSSSPGETATR
jgi:Zn-dependent protease